MSNSTRPSSSNSYDERFVVPLEASRRGAHRARVSPLMAVLPVVAVVAIVGGAIALVYLLFGGLGGSDVGSGATVTAGPSASPTASASPSGGSLAGPSDGASTSPEDSTSSSLAPGQVDKSITLDVFNGTSPLVNGIARRASTKLSAAGWPLGQIKTWTGTPVSGTIVYYGSDDQRASAQSVVKSLGHGQARLSAAKAGAGMTVVIGNDYPGAGVRSTERTAGASSTGSAAPRTTSAAGKTSTTRSERAAASDGGTTTTTTTTER